MRHIRIPSRQRIRNAEAVKVHDNTQPDSPQDPNEALLMHLEAIKRIVQDADVMFEPKDLASIKRSIAAIEKRIVPEEE